MRGSRTSRKPSPRMLKPSTAIKMAMPGPKAVQGAKLIKPRPVLSIEPQLGSGGCAPSPRKERPASERRAYDIASVICSSSSGMAFGSTWRNMIWTGPAPLALLASTYCSCTMRSEEHTSELQSHRDLHSFPTRRSSDLIEQQRHGVRQHVAEHDLDWACPAGSARLDILLLHDDQPGGAGDPHENRDKDNADGNHHVRQRRSQHRQHGDGQQQRRKGEQDIGEAHDDHVPGAPVKGREHAKRAADNQSDRD